MGNITFSRNVQIATKTVFIAVLHEGGKICRPQGQKEHRNRQWILSLLFAALVYLLQESRQDLLLKAPRLVDLVDVSSQLGYYAFLILEILLFEF